MHQQPLALAVLRRGREPGRQQPRGHVVAARRDVRDGGDVGELDIRHALVQRRPGARARVGQPVETNQGLGRRRRQRAPAGQPRSRARSQAARASSSRPSAARHAPSQNCAAPSGAPASSARRICTDTVAGVSPSAYRATACISSPRPRSEAGTALSRSRLANWRWRARSRSARDRRRRRRAGDGVEGRVQDLGIHEARAAHAR